MPPIPTDQTIAKIEKAMLTPDGGDPILVQFNPTSLVYTVEAKTKQEGKDPKRRQHNSQTTGKLTMDLQFDTTDTGEDVRRYTSEVALLMESSAGEVAKAKKRGANQAPAPVLTFSWGAYEFKGIMDSYK